MIQGVVSGGQEIESFVYLFFVDNTILPHDDQLKREEYPCSSSGKVAKPSRFIIFAQLLLKKMFHLRPTEKSRASGMEHHCSLEERCTQSFWASMIATAAARLPTSHD
jgi:hypothetical protein